MSREATPPRVGDYQSPALLSALIDLVMPGTTSGPPLMVEVTGEAEGGEGDWGSAVVPKHWEVKRVALDDWFEATARLPGDRPVFLSAPFTRVAVTEEIRHSGWRTSPVMGGVMLSRALAQASPGQRIGALLPASVLAASNSEVRVRLFESGDLRCLIEFDAGWIGESRLHESFVFSLVCINRREQEDAPAAARFLRIPREGDPKTLKDELGELLNRQGGQTSHGFVRRPPLDWTRPLRVAAFDPMRHRRLAHLRDLGRVQRLEELVDIKRGRLHLDLAREGELADDEDEGVLVLTGGNLTAASLDLSTVKRVREAPSAAMLLPGDICVSGVRGEGEVLRVHAIEEADLPLAASQHVLVLRPRSEIAPAHREFLVEYLRSHRAAALLSHDIQGPHVRVDQVAELAVPLPDETLLSAIQDLRETEQQLAAWSRDVEAAISGILGDTAADAGVLQLRSTGQLLRQRVAAARQLDDLSYRVRNLFPFPVALPWRRVQTAAPNLEGYVTVLECAESMTGYLAVLSILLARSLNRELGAVRSLSEKLASSTQGVSMSDWSEMVREVTGRAVMREVKATTPFVELTELMTDDSPAWPALRRLTELRNDQSHNRGPKGRQVEPTFREAYGLLEQMYETCQWLCDYPIRLVERTSWDDYAGSGHYTYRELVGDHYLVSQAQEPTTVPTLNPGRLYLLDRAGDLHLISPLILWHECEQCGLPSAFFLDNYRAREGLCRLRAMDHNHSVLRRDVVRPLSQLGLLPAAAD